MSEPVPAGAVRIVGRYALHDEIASGGMATVHLGRLLGPAGFSRTVAIKRLHVHLAKDPEFVSMLLDEARIVARIRHPNVVPTLDVVSAEGELFLVMEYVQGESLARLLRLSSATNQKLAIEVVVPVLIGVLHGLHAAHEAKTEHGKSLDIVHRDVSPQNVLVGVDGVARVLDFGVAKAVGRLQTTREGQLKGKLAYMAPEQIQGEPSRRTDVYAASAVLWEALTGKRLFEGENEASVLARVLTAPIEAPSKYAPEVSRELDAIVLKGLSRDKDARFQTAREMARALEKCGPIAAASDIGEVVEALASKALTERANRVADIESNSAVNLRALSPVVMNTPSSPALEAPPSSRRAGASGELASSSHIDTATQLTPAESARRSLASMREVAPSTPSPLAPEAPPSRSRAPLLVLAAALAVPLVALLVWSLTRSNDVSPASSAITPAASSPAAEASVAVSAPQVVDVASAAPATTASDAPPSVAPPATIAAPKRPSTPSSPPPAATPKKNCSPPYTIDAAGFKHYKRECLTK